MNNAALLTDGYKLFHKDAYLDDIKVVYSNYTSRNGKYANIANNEEVVFVGLQYFIKDVLLGEWQKNFFDLPKEEAVFELKQEIDVYLNTDYNVAHLEALWDLGHIPIEIKALPEGVVVPYGVPPVTFRNTDKRFPWLSNYLETIFSTENWPIQTSATTARSYLKNITKAFEETGGIKELIPFMCHDFSMRGMFGRHAAAMSGFGHICSFLGSDTLPAIPFAKKYYNADSSIAPIMCSVPATEHSTSTSAILALSEREGISKLEAEVKYVREHLFKKVPTGILSHVSDSFDFFKFVTGGLPLLKDDIMARDGTFVIRPDSGDPVKILTGYIMPDGDYDSVEEAVADAPYQTEQECVMINGIVYKSGWINDNDYEIDFDTTLTIPEVKGLVELLWEQFGGSYTEKSYKLLDSHIGAIYGDSITLERQQQIIDRLKAKWFVPSVVLGVGSFSYQYVTRDTHGSAVKCTWVDSDNGSVNVMKDPATDTKKKSACGLLRVELEDGKYVLYDQQTPEQEQQGELKTVFKDGKLLVETSLEEIRKRVQESL